MKQFQVLSPKLQLNIIDSGYKKVSRTRLKKKLLLLVIVFEKLLNKIESKKIRWECHVTLCGVRKIQSLNLQYRGKDKITDVLSFPLHESPESFLPPLVSLGDIFVCKEVSAKQARQFTISVDDEMIHLIIHGFLHLLGYDHDRSAKDEKVMQEKEKWILDKLRDLYGRN